MRGRRIRQGLCLLPPLLVAVIAVRHRSTLLEGLERMRGAQWPWLLVAVVLTCLTWVAAACTRQGAVVRPLPKRRLLATQFAAGAANHLLPTGLGASAVNLRFMTVCGLSLARSSAALALYLLAQSAARAAVLIGLLCAFPDALDLGVLLPGDALASVLPSVGLFALLVAGAVLCAGRVRRVLGRFLRTALSEAGEVHKRPARACALWGGAFAFPLLQAAGLVAVAESLDLGVPAPHVAVAYLAGAAAAGLVPTPGNLGSMEAALLVALVAAGGATAVATAVVLTYRLVTVWLPLVPGALTLGALVRMKVI